MGLVELVGAVAVMVLVNIFMTGMAAGFAYKAVQVKLAETPARPPAVVNTKLVDAQLVKKAETLEVKITELEGANVDLAGKLAEYVELLAIARGDQETIRNENNTLKAAQAVLLENVRHLAEFRTLVGEVEYASRHPEVIFPGRGGGAHACPCCWGLSAQQYKNYPGTGHMDNCPMKKLVEAVAPKDAADEDTDA